MKTPRFGHNRRKIQRFLASTGSLGLPLGDATVAAELLDVPAHPLATLLPFPDPAFRLKRHVQTMLIELKAPSYPPRWLRPLTLVDGTLLDGRHRLWVWQELQTNDNSLNRLAVVDVPQSEELEVFLRSNIATLPYPVRRACLGLAVAHYHRRHGPQRQPLAVPPSKWLDKIRGWCNVSRATMYDALDAAVEPRALRFLAVIEGLSHTLVTAKPRIVADVRRPTLNPKHMLESQSKRRRPVDMSIFDLGMNLQDYTKGIARKELVGHLERVQLEIREYLPSLNSKYNCLVLPALSTWHPALLSFVAQLKEMGFAYHRYIWADLGVAPKEAAPCPESFLLLIFSKSRKLKAQNLCPAVLTSPWRRAPHARLANVFSSSFRWLGTPNDIFAVLYDQTLRQGLILAMGKMRCRKLIVPDHFEVNFRADKNQILGS